MTKSNEKKSSFSEVNLHGVCWDFFIGAQDTTVNTLKFAIILLAANQRVQVGCIPDFLHPNAPSNRMAMLTVVGSISCETRSLPNKKLDYLQIQKSESKV